jgi:tetratricopeptide (TPR) repeat protein
MAEADRSVAAGDTTGAIAAYRGVIEDEPANSDARVRLSRLLLSAGRNDEAVNLLREAVAVAPHEPLLDQTLGKTLEGLKRFPEALAAFDAGLVRHPDSRGLRDGRWRCLYTLGIDEPLLAEVNEAIALDPSDSTARYTRAIACCAPQGAEAFRAALERELVELPGDALLLRALEAAGP